MRTVALDFETFYNGSFSVRTLGNWAYTRDPRFDAYMLSICDGSEYWVGHPRDFDWKSLEGAFLISHNAAFDSTVYESLVERGLVPSVEYAGWQCTANLCAYVCGYRDLANSFEALFNEPVSKAMRNWMSNRHWSDVVAKYPEKARLMKEYALQDVRRCWLIWRHFNHLWPDHEKRLSEITLRATKIGTHVDLLLLEEYLAAASEAKHDIELSIPWCPEEAASSPQAIAEHCQKVGIPVPPLKKTDEAGFDEWESFYGARFDWVKNIGLWRQVAKILSTLTTFKERLRPDGTVEVPLKYFGAHTGRWSGDAGLNFLNLRKEPLELPSGKQIDVRKLCIASPGKRFIIADYAQIEPRVLAWVVGDKEFLKAVQGGMSVYEAHARATMGWTGGVLKNENKDLYALAKARVLGLGYGCGWEKFIAVARSMAGLELSEEESRKIVADFRESNKRIVAFWNANADALRTSLKEPGDHKVHEIELPSGRVMRYPELREKIMQSPGVVLNPKTGDKEGGMRTRRDVTCFLGGIPKSIHGAFLTENVVQAIARDIFVDGFLRLDDMGLHLPFHSYDEFVVDAPPDVSVEEVRTALEQAPTWMPGIPIETEIKESPCYLK